MRRGEDKAHARGVVDRADAHVPAIQVRAEDDNLVREVGARDFTDDIGGSLLRQLASGALDPQAHGATAGELSFEGVGIRIRNATAGMRGTSCGWREPPVCGKRCALVLRERMTTPTGAERRRGGGTCAAHAHGARVFDPIAPPLDGVVEEHDAILHGAGGQIFQGRQILDPDRLGFDAGVWSADGAAQRQGGHGLRPGLEYGEFGLTTHPLRHVDFLRVYVLEAQPAHLFLRPRNGCAVARCAGEAWPDFRGERFGQLIGGGVTLRPLEQGLRGGEVRAAETPWRLTGGARSGEQCEEGDGELDAWSAHGMCEHRKDLSTARYALSSAPPSHSTFS
ncbi:MAG: hypothetical protein WDO56_01625 [Gammaproteobacteria bacterium]